MPAGTFKMYAGGEEFLAALHESLERAADVAFFMTALETLPDFHDSVEVTTIDADDLGFDTLDPIAVRVYDDHPDGELDTGWMPVTN